MIDPENAIPIGDIPNHVPRNRKTGKKISKATVYRWIYVGVRGEKLSTWFFGGQRYTSLEALDRFFAAITAAANGETPSARTRKQRDKAIRQAERELEQAGI